MAAEFMHGPFGDIQIVTDKAALSMAAADAFVVAALDAIDRRSRFLVALSGGSTPRGLHQLLASEDYRGRVAWKKVHWFWGDERCVPPDHEESNYRMASETLLTPLGITRDNIHRVPTEAEDWPHVADSYQQQLADVFECSYPGSPPRFDLVLLGMGEDGHTASLFPNTAALSEATRWVVANDVPQLGTTRITLTARCINAAREICFMVAGKNKASRLCEVLLGPADVQRLPSQMMREAAGRVRWFVDEEAAAALPK